IPDVSSSERPHRHRAACAVSLDAPELTDHFSAANRDRDGRAQVHDQRAAVEDGLINRLHSAVTEHIADRWECLVVDKHRLGEADQANPGSAVEVHAAVTESDGTCQVSVAGNDDIDRWTDRTNDAFHGDVHGVNVESSIVPQFAL